MTTLSKEEFKLLLSNSVASPDLDKVQDAIADLVAENERLKSIPMKYRRMAFNAELQDETDKLRTALAAAEADNERLREVTFSAQTTFDAYASIHNAKNPPDLEKASFNQSRSDMCSEALAQPRDDSALREMIATAIDEFVFKFKRHVGGDGEFWLHELEDYRDSIRTLAEKAKGK